MLKLFSKPTRIEKFLKAIDKKKVEKTKYLLNLNKNNLLNGSDSKDIVLEIFDNNQLNQQRLLFLVKNCAEDLDIQSLINKIMKTSKKRLLYIIFERYYFYDNEFIINLLMHYKNQKSVSLIDLEEDMKKYKIIYCDEKCCSSSYIVGTFLNGTIQKGNIYLIKYLLKLGIKINPSLDENNWTALHHACKYGQENILKYLIERGADINRKTRERYTTLQIAIEYKQENIAIYLIEHGANVNEKTHDNDYPLHMAILFKQENVAKCLIEHGANVNELNYVDVLPLQVAIKTKQENIAKLLIERGAVKSHNKKSITCMICPGVTGIYKYYL